MRPTPDDGRPTHGLHPDEFTPYQESDGRVRPDECDHPIFLDYLFPSTGICLECGCEITCGEWTLLDGGRALSDDELLEWRATWANVWDLSPTSP